MFHQPSPSATSNHALTATSTAETRGYLASLPERSARALIALGAGVIHETASLLLPAGVRRSRLYQSTVGRLLRMLIEGVGQVQGIFPAEPLSVNELLIRKTAGNVVELASILAVGWSPIWLLAAVSDLTGGNSGGETSRDTPAQPGEAHP